jgi:hypothetical protein
LDYPSVVLTGQESRSGMMVSVERRAVCAAQWGGDTMFRNIALVATLTVTVTGAAFANSCPRHMANID